MAGSEDRSQGSLPGDLAYRLTPTYGPPIQRRTSRVPERRRYRPESFSRFPQRPIRPEGSVWDMVPYGEQPGDEANRANEPEPHRPPVFPVEHVVPCSPCRELSGHTSNRICRGDELLPGDSAGVSAWRCLDRCPYVSAGPLPRKIERRLGVPVPGARDAVSRPGGDPGQLAVVALSMGYVVLSREGNRTNPPIASQNRPSADRPAWTSGKPMAGEHQPTTVETRRVETDPVARSSGGPMGSGPRRSG